MGPAPTEGLAQVPTELTFEAFYIPKENKPLLKGYVNNEMFFKSLKSFYANNIIACYLQYIYLF